MSYSGVRRKKNELTSSDAIVADIFTSVEKAVISGKNVKGFGRFDLHDYGVKRTNSRNMPLKSYVKVSEKRENASMVYGPYELNKENKLESDEEKINNTVDGNTVDNLRKKSKKEKKQKKSNNDGEDIEVKKKKEKKHKREKKRKRKRVKNSDVDGEQEYNDANQNLSEKYEVISESDYEDDEKNEHLTASTSKGFPATKMDDYLRAEGYQKGISSTAVALGKHHATDVDMPLRKDRKDILKHRKSHKQSAAQMVPRNVKLKESVTKFKKSETKDSHRKLQDAFEPVSDSSDVDMFAEKELNYQISNEASLKPLNVKKPVEDDDNQIGKSFEKRSKQMTIKPVVLAAKLIQQLPIKARPKFEDGEVLSDHEKRDNESSESDEDVDESEGALEDSDESSRKHKKFKKSSSRRSLRKRKHSSSSSSGSYRRSSDSDSRSGSSSSSRRSDDDSSRSSRSRTRSRTGSKEKQRYNTYDQSNKRQQQQVFQPRGRNVFIPRGGRFPYQKVIIDRFGKIKGRGGFFQPNLKTRGRYGRGFFTTGNVRFKFAMGRGQYRNQRFGHVQQMKLKGRTSYSLAEDKRRSSYHEDEEEEEEKQDINNRSRLAVKDRSHSKSAISSSSSDVDDEDEALMNDQQKIDKKKLYQIARRNVSAMLQCGSIQQIKQMTSEEIAKLRAGGKSLVEVCRQIQSKRDDSDNEDNAPKRKKQDEEEEPFKHPFAVKPDKSIVLNIPNATALPTKTPQERVKDETRLRTAFPVSSGQQHRAKESEWVLVEPTESRFSVTSAIVAKSATTVENVEPATAVKLPTVNLAALDPLHPLALPPPPAPPKLDRVFEEEKDDVEKAVNVSDIVSVRLRAIRRLQENQNDVEALKMMHSAEAMMKSWAESKHLPGQYVGNTGVQTLSPDELGPNNPSYQAWAKRDSLADAKPIDSCIGKSLLQKMGWKPGEGLGKTNTGALEPLTLDVKNDRRGLVALDEVQFKRRSAAPVQQIARDFQGKHPVSALMELCSKRRWGPPRFSCVESGPSNNRRFQWTVNVNGIDYQSGSPTGNKKSGKAQAAAVVLQSLGLIPRDTTLPIVLG